MQKTLARDVTCRSVGLHSGRKVRMTIRPAAADEGIVFCRSDVGRDNMIQATPSNVSDTTLATTLGLNGTRISTVEHLLSALFGLGIDNAVVETDSFEIPIMDGSSEPFVALLKEAGLEEQHREKKCLVITKPLSVTDGMGTVSLHPSALFEITCHIDFTHPAVGKQSHHLVFSHDSYERTISPARTFGFLHEVEYLQAKGLALGGSLKNAIVLNGTKVINKEGLRFPDEFVKHKILDAIGDISLLGVPIRGHLVARRSGHKLNNMLLRTLLQRPDCWTMETLEPEVAAQPSQATVEEAAGSVQA
ncbi:MAG: UDP-3-O-[3-hydroxymyristoyl] N-acetylglucosamine deacetylase [delta proteobacterium MLS_D]|jgi:UDP-3-O-[3-hydroxymyristoyl] N-acetylglucosamine deacetylase|nr:MAG: UDP-3-O-[3-hydroxymyristoyl] N-acetylglucosamine deacetylase [delta proteobacterium MLS_D]